MEHTRGESAPPAGSAVVPTAERPVDVDALARLEPLIIEELHRITSAEESGRKDFRVSVALKQMFVRLFGTGRDAGEQAMFLSFAAPHMRRILLRKATAVTPHTKIAGFGAVEVERWLVKLERVAPLQARMIDLHYFSGLSEKETAAVLGVPERTVARDIRFVRAWLTSARRGKPRPDTRG